MLKSIPRFLLWSFVFSVSMMIYWGDRFAAFILRHDRKSEYVRKGHCQRTGLCCRNVGIEIPGSWAKKSWVVRAFQGWYRTVHNFQPKKVVRDRLLIFDCGHLRSGNVCGIYPFRPKLCREYPFKTLFGRVELFKGCGYWFVERKKLGTFEERVAESEHQQERMRFLQEKQGAQEGMSSTILP